MQVRNFTASRSFTATSFSTDAETWALAKPVFVVRRRPYAATLFPDGTATLVATDGLADADGAPEALTEAPLKAVTAKKPRAPRKRAVKSA